MKITSIVLLLTTSLLTACATTPSSIPRDQTQREVETAERAFAKTMADRDFAKFQTFLADEAIFFGGSEPLRGKAQIAAGWKPFFDKAAAPFSWEPARVEPLDSGTLALSTGPVRDANGKCFATFNSIWRREAPGVWRVVFDKGSDGCESKAAPSN